MIEQAVRNGARLDAWDEYFRYDAWLDAFRTCGVDPDFYTRALDRDAVLPWQTVSVGVRKDFLWRERQQAYASAVTPDCRTKCTGCGANLLYQEGSCDA